MNINLKTICTSERNTIVKSTTPNNTGKNENKRSQAKQSLEKKKRISHQISPE